MGTPVEELQEEVEKIKRSFWKEGMGMSKNKTKIVLRKDDEMEHLLIYRNGILVSDAYEAFPKFTTEEILMRLHQEGIINGLEIERIEE